MAAPLDQARVHRQDRLVAIQRLDLGFFLYTQHDPILRRCQIRAADVGNLTHELGIGGEAGRLGAPRIDPIRAPRLDHRRRRDLQPRRQQSRGPVDHAQRFRWRHQRGSHDLASSIVRDRPERFSSVRPARRSPRACRATGSPPAATPRPTQRPRPCACLPRPAARCAPADID